MARPRKPERDKAKKMYLESGGKISTKELAAAVGVDDGRIRKWKSLDKWEDALQNQPKKKGGQPGNKNAAGETPAKRGNKNAVTHGAFASVSIEDLTEEQRNAILSMQPGETLSRMNEELQGLLGRKEYLTGLLQGFTDPAKQQEYAEASTVVINVPGPAAGAPGVAVATDNVPEGAPEPNPDGSVNAYDEAGLKVGTVDAATAEAAAGVDVVIVEGGQAARNEQQDGANR